MVAVAMIAVLQTRPDRALAEYLRRQEPAYKVELKSRSDSEILATLTSQTWQGGDWTHDLHTVYPKILTAAGMAILVITGGPLNSKDVAIARSIADDAGLPVVTLYNIPNQPLFQKVEDDLVAHTFVQYLQTKDATWPLLFPMVKSTIKAMDAMETLTGGTKNPLHQFIVTGASKRGWTTWLTAASGDTRVVGISPMVIDMPNIPMQMKHMEQSWRTFSEKIDDYTQRGLQELVNTPGGMELVRMVDPFAYRGAIKAPTLVTSGGNDPFWTTDAVSIYWDGFKQPKWLSVVPNAGHEAWGKPASLSAFTAFCRKIAAKKRLPVVTWRISGRTISVDAKGEKPKRALLWTASSDTLRFQNSQWRTEFFVTNPKLPMKFVVGDDGRNRAAFVQLEFTEGSRLYPLCTAPVVLPRKGR